MHPLWIAGAVALILYLVVRRRHHGKLTLGVGALAAAGALLIGFGVIELPNVEHLIEEAGQALGKWTYLAVGILAFLETGASIGLVAPGETTVIVGGLVAGQGEISLFVLIAIVWACAVAGDLTSYTLGRRLGHEFMVKHGARVKITEARLEQVEAFFDRRGGSTILIGRFIGLVRAIAPFIAGASRDAVAQVPALRHPRRGPVGDDLLRPRLRLLALVRPAHRVGVARAVRVRAVRRGGRRDRLPGPAPAQRGAPGEDEGMDRRAAREPSCRPVAPYLRAGWARIGQPAARASEAPARFVWNRLTPGDLGLEVTTLLAIAAVGSFVFFLLADGLSERDLLVGDQVAADIADRIRMGWLVDVSKIVTALGSFVAVAIAVAATSLWAVARRRYLDAGVLVVASLLTYLLTHLAKAHYDRPRPADALVDVAGSAFPSAHAAYSVAWIACAVVLVRTGGSWAGRTAVVTAAVILAAAIGLTRIYFNVHYLSDVEAGWGLGATVFALLGIVALVVGRLRHNEAPAA